MPFRASSMLNAVAAIVAQSETYGDGAALSEFTVNLVPFSRKTEALQPFMEDSALMSRCLAAVNGGAETCLYEVDSGDAHIGTVMVLYISDTVFETYYEFTV